MSLTETFLKRGKIGSRRKYDGNGLYIQLNSAKTKYRLWRFKYRRPLDKKEDTLSLGTYPEVSLAEAREKAREAKKLIAQELDPKQEMKAAKLDSQFKAQMIFEKIAVERLDSQNLKPSTRTKKEARFKNYVYPWLGKKPIDSISTRDLAILLKKLIADEKYETANKVKRELGQVFSYAAQSGLIINNPAHNLHGLVPTRKPKHQPAITDPKKFGVLLSKIDGYNANSVVGFALRLVPLVFQRPGELVSAEWREIDFEKRIWSIPHEKKKEHRYLTVDHAVPLSTQSVKLLKELKKITGNSKFIFSNQKLNDKHISTAAVIKALRSLGYDTSSEQSVHGFRASARTLIEEQLNINPKYIRQQLSHSVNDPMGRAYDRTQFLSERRDMMQKWADYLDKLKKKHQS